MKLIIDVPIGVLADDIIAQLNGYSAATGTPKLMVEKYAERLKGGPSLKGQPEDPILFTAGLLIVPFAKISNLALDRENPPADGGSYSVLQLDTTPAEYAILNMLHEKLKSKAPF